MPRPISPRTPTGLRALAVLATASVALGAATGTAAAATGEPVRDAARPRPAAPGASGAQATLGSLPHVTGPVSGLRPNPLAGTGVDPLDNEVATQVADFRPLSSKELTGPVAQARSIGSIPVLGAGAKTLGG